MSSLHSALIVDADPKGLEALVYGFQGADWRITACPTPETASLLVRAAGAEIVVVASRNDHDKAHSLIRQVRSKEAFRTLPLLVLGPEELRKTLKESGDADLLPLPAFVRDVLTASQLLVEAGASMAQNPGDEPSFGLPITAATTLSLIRTLCGLGRSGLLELERKGRHGEILFHQGELTAAQVHQLQGMAAVQHVLVWNDGALKLHLRPIVRRGQLHQTAQEFLEELDRFQRDFAHAMKDVGPPSTVYSRIEERLQSSANAVPAEVTPVVRLCDGQRTLSDIIDESPFRVLDTIRIVARLVELAILARRDPKPDSDAKPARLPIEEFWETARIVGSATPHTPPARADGGTTPTPQPGDSQLRAPPEARNESLPGQGMGHTHKKTLEIVTTSVRTPEADPAPAAPSPATGTQGIGPGESGIVHTPFTAVHKMTSTGAQASGIIEPRERRTRSNPRAVPERTSIVVDTATIAMARAHESATADPAIPSPMAPSPSSELAAAGPVVRITGEIQAAPSRRTSQQMPAARMSIQLDATLASEPANAGTPAVASSVPETEPSAALVTGEIQVPPSGKISRRLERVSSSFQIDPSLTTAPHMPTGHEAASSPGEPAVAPTEKRRQSGSFSPLERDFFEREADLYKVDTAESFADLDEKRSKAASKNSPGKKPDRPSRK